MRSEFSAHFVGFKPDKVRRRKWRAKKRREPVGLFPVAERLDVGCRTVSKPAIQLGLVLELLPPEPRHDHEAALNFRQRRQIAPESFKLGDRENILLAMAPALL